MQRILNDVALGQVPKKQLHEKLATGVFGVADIAAKLVDLILFVK
jgi:hypothetical protein